MKKDFDFNGYFTIEVNSYDKLLETLLQFTEDFNYRNCVLYAEGLPNEIEEMRNEFSNYMHMNDMNKFICRKLPEYFVVLDIRNDIKHALKLVIF